MTHDPLLYVTLALAVAFLLAAIAASPVRGHDWYPPACCHEIVMEDGRIVSGDCGVADLIGQTAEGLVLRQRQTNLTVVIPPTFPRSKVHPNTHDGQYHVCVSRGDDYETAPGHVYCLFEPSLN